MVTHEMQDLWTRLEKWLAIYAPDKLESLALGATEGQIARAETLMSVNLPEDFKTSCRIHNGQEANDLMDGREFLSLENIYEQWSLWKSLLDKGEFNGIDSEATGPIRDDWWNERWIPITHDGSGDHDCLDLAPAEGGHIGQVIDFWHDMGHREIKAPSFIAWFAAFVEGCENGSYVYSDDYGIIEKEILKSILSMSKTISKTSVHPIAPN